MERAIEPAPSTATAPLALEAVGKNPTDRGKKGTKRSVLTDEKGLPLAVVFSGANTHGVKLLEETLDHIVTCLIKCIYDLQIKMEHHRVLSLSSVL